MMYWCQAYDADLRYLNLLLTSFPVRLFTADIGGNMGLFLGCSILSVFEFVDLFILLCFRNCRRSRKVRISR